MNNVVFVVVDGKAAQRVVRLGVVDETNSEVLEGIAASALGDIDSDYDGIAIALSGGARNNRVDNCFVLNAAADSAAYIVRGLCGETMMSRQ